MTADTVKVIISVELAERKIKTGQMEIGIDEKLDEPIHQGLNGLGKASCGSIVHRVDDGLREVVPAGWKSVDREESQFMTSVGLIQFKRRIYRDETGQRRKPVDELLGIEPRSRQSLSVKQKRSCLASELPYREAAEKWLSP